MIPTITAFEQSPDNGLGLARDMPVRWALEEVGQSYDVNLVSFAELKAPDHLALHPFGQIPTYQEDGLTLFESGAIVLHVAQSRAGLLPEKAHARSRAIMWMFSALNTIEPVVWDYDIAPLLEGDKPWHAERMIMLEGRLRTRLASLS
ncbi:glutathione S-transferase, partial [Hyphomonas chukchiensis]|uniref:glutathione S-transferase family protein n=1 Tax=Hyphomonas chukchiensis TaxID=1280947 RepID=UPI0030FCD1D9